MKALIATLICVCSFNLFAFDGDKPVAPQEEIDKAKELCEKYAVEDEVSQDELPNYLLECVNSELEEQGYQTIESLDK